MKKKNTITPMTAQGAEILRKKLNELKKNKIPYIIKLISSSRKNGDLKENSEYHAAKEEQSFFENKIKEIEDKLSNAVIIDTNIIKNYKKIVFGIPFTILKIDNNKKFNYTIVGKDEADIKKNMISINSPIARSLIGKYIKDIITVNTPNGNIKYKILKIGKN
ncbi:transcription elongation factor GreA [Candidatus Annandia pinicola]|uniref:transcription elongation factor GreA n=1 Tax=Candidatus Annandia pinicola TaxID=1345117 RepID=UPI001D01871F|nr:transcription elongation factor GreA [Candidatus Annandia pinicola]UDG80284.1 Transcription elongation factor GreA [Candidatus Annandia pinicola]